MRNETMIKRRPKGINWHTAIFMGLCMLERWPRFSSSVAGAAGCDFALVDFRQPGRRHGFSQTPVHRGYKTPRIEEYFLTICRALALEGGPINWIVTHRIHHAHADALGDPHTPRNGGWWAHLGWMLNGTGSMTVRLGALCP